MCSQWVDSFDVFLRDVGLCPEGMVLDRENNDGNYEPGNVRWVTPAVSQANKRQNGGRPRTGIGGFDKIQVMAYKCRNCGAVIHSYKKNAMPKRCGHCNKFSSNRKPGRPAKSIAEHQAAISERPMVEIINPVEFVDGIPQRREVSREEAKELWPDKPSDLPIDWIRAILKSPR